MGLFDRWLGKRELLNKILLKTELRMLSEVTWARYKIFIRRGKRNHNIL